MRPSWGHRGPSNSKVVPRSAEESQKNPEWLKKTPQDGPKNEPKARTRLTEQSPGVFGPFDPFVFLPCKVKIVDFMVGK